MVSFPTPIGGNITDDDIGRKNQSHRCISTSHAPQYLAPFFYPFTPSFFPQLLGIISNVSNGTLQALAARYSLWNGEGYLCKPSIKLTKPRVVLYSLRLHQAYGGISRPSNVLLFYQQATFGRPPSLQYLILL